MTTSPLELEAVVPLSGRLLSVITRSPNQERARTNLTSHAICSFTQKCLDLGAATAILYDFFLTFEKERKVVWAPAGSKITFMKVLWVAVRVRSPNELPILHLPTSTVMAI